MVRARRWHVFLGLLVAALVWPYPGRTQNNQGTPAAAPPAPDVEWRAYGATEHSTRYAPLEQINKDTVKNLEIAWTWKFDNFGSGGAETITTETTPLMINGVLYFTAGQRRSVVAANPATGETLWVWRPNEGARFDRAPRKVHRGVSYWRNGADERILVVTPGYQLVALNARTGQPIPGFGTNGIVDLFKQAEVDPSVDLTGQIGNSSPPVIVNEVVVVGPAMLVGTLTVIVTIGRSSP